MKNLTIQLYSYRELPDDARQRVVRDKQNEVHNDPNYEHHTLDECIDSLKAIARAMHIRLTDWCIGPYNRNNYARTDSELTGDKALATFVRCLVDKGYSRPKKFTEMEFPGICGFTGICFDDDLAEEMMAALLDGSSMDGAFDRAADQIMTICERDLEYLTSEEGILEYLDEEETIYSANGKNLEHLLAS